MADYTLSQAADGDLTGIYLYSYDTFGEEAADAYYLGLCECLRALADTPGLGHWISDLAGGVFAYRHRRHVIFYVTESQGIFIVRVLHEAMDFPRHFAAGSGDES